MGDHDDAKKKAQLEKYRQLTAAQSSIQDSLTWAKKGLNRNPSPEQRRALDESILDMAERITILDARILSVRNSGGNDTVSMPTPEQIAATGALAAEVELLTNDNLTAAAALSVATKGLKLASELAGDPLTKP